MTSNVAPIKLTSFSTFASAQVIHSFFSLAFSKGGLAFLPMGNGEILDLVILMLPIKIPWSIFHLPCAIKLAFHVSVRMGLGKKTPMTHVHPFL